MAPPSNAAPARPIDRQRHRAHNGIDHRTIATTVWRVTRRSEPVAMTNADCDERHGREHGL
jgi:hypothetical protein